MTLTQMQYFNTVCMYGNISIAARELYITQPALSAALADLEKEVGFRLFLRKSRGVALTEEGQQLQSYVKSVLSRYQMMENEIPFISQSQKVLRVGFRPFAGESTFFRVYPPFGQEHPEMILRVNEISSYQPGLYLQEGQIDFLFARKDILPDDMIDGYRCHQVGVEQVSLYAHMQCPLCRQERVTFEDMAEYPFVFWEGHGLFEDRLRKIMKERGCRLNVIARLPQISGVLQFVSSNLAIGFASGDYLEEVRTIRRIPFWQEENDADHFSTEMNVYAFWKKETERVPAKKAFADYLQSMEPEDF